MSYLAVSSHRSMALDARRNDSYAEALRQAIGPDSIVLDLGAGTGIHGLMAARLGAKRVYLVEPEDILFVADEIAALNGLKGTVHCLHGRIEDTPPPEPVDVIVSVLTGNFLVTEDLLPALFHARDTVLKPGGVLIPSAATMEGVPVSAAALHAKEIAAWSVPQHGLDLSPARVYARNTVFFRSNERKDTTRLAAPRTLYTLDFYRDNYTSIHADVTYEITASGPCHGWLGWFSMKLGDRWLSTSPYEEPVHWSPAFLPLDPPMVFEKGEHVAFSLDRAPFGDWTWKVSTTAASQQRSTMLSSPMNLATLKKAALDYAPRLNDEGRALMHALSLCDGLSAVDVIARSLSEQFPERFHSRAEALSFVQRLAKRYS